MEYLEIAENENINEAEDLYIQKSNRLITARYKQDLNSQKILAVSLTKIREVDGQLEATLHPAEIRRLLNLEGDSNLYKKLRDVSQSMASGSVITIENGDSFQTFSMITNISYIDQKFTVTYNKTMTPLLSSLKNNYTRFHLATLLNLTKAYSFRLYEVLKKEAWKIQKAPSGIVKKRYGLSELKCVIGIVNIDAPYIQKFISEGRDWDYIVENAKTTDKQFNVWADFKKRVLDPSVEEINERTDLHIGYNLIRGGRGAKVQEIEFSIKENTIKDEEIIKDLKDAEKSVTEVQEGTIKAGTKGRKVVDREAYAEIRQKLIETGVDPSGFTLAVCGTLMKYAGNDVSVIKKEIEYSATVEYISNYYAWLTEAVKNRYSDTAPVETINGNSEEAAAIKELRKPPSEAVLNNIWEKYKEDKEFDDFISTFEFPDVLAVESMYPVEDRLKMYIEFRKKIASSK